jgi:hypothetical protein
MPWYRLRLRPADVTLRYRLERRAAANDCGLWQLIYDDIHTHHEQFQALTRQFAELSTEPRDAPLSLLRLYDILVWMKVAG